MRPPSLCLQLTCIVAYCTSLTMQSFILFTVLAASAAAFPAMLDGNPKILRQASELVARSSPKTVRRQTIPSDPLGISKAQTNCGPTPCVTFDPADQLVSVTSEHAYASPAPDEIRGPCPGLNAAANHGYLPRSGIASLEETVSGLGAGKCKWAQVHGSR